MRAPATLPLRRAGGAALVASAMILDPRLTQLAAGLCRFSTELQRGERVLIDAFDVPEAMVVALIRAARQRGALPYVQLHRARLTLKEKLRGCY